jgi:hypothetical protein
MSYWIIEKNEKEIERFNTLLDTKKYLKKYVSNSKIRQKTTYDLLKIGKGNRILEEIEIKGKNLL